MILCRNRRECSATACASGVEEWTVKFSIDQLSAMWSVRNWTPAIAAPSTTAVTINWGNFQLFYNSTTRNISSCSYVKYFHIIFLFQLRYHEFKIVTDHVPSLNSKLNKHLVKSFLCFLLPEQYLYMAIADVIVLFLVNFSLSFF